MKICPRCKCTIPKNARKCPYCNSNLSSAGSGCLLIVVICFIWFLVFIIKTSSSKTTNEVQTEVDTNSSENVVIEIEDPEDSVAEDVDLFENNGIKISYTGYDPGDGWFEPEIGLLIENNTDKNYTITVDNLSVDGYMNDGTFYAEVAAGKKINDEIGLDLDDLKKAGLSADSLQKIEFYFSISNNDDYSDDFKTEMITIELQGSETSE
jgi:hypothetical protein